MTDRSKHGKGGGFADSVRSAEGVWEPGTPRGQWEEVRWQFDSDQGPVSRRRRRNVDYETFTPTPISDWAPTLPGELAGDISEAESAIQALNESADPALRPLARLLLRTESIASSRAEGLAMGADQIARAEVLIDGGDRPRSSISAEIVQNIAAMETAIRDACGEEPFTVAHIEAIHAKLTEGSSFAGTTRDKQNWIGGNNQTPVGATFVPPPPGRVKPLLLDLCAAINDDRLPPVLQAAIVHAQFETIHPFLDGNGRTGRALIHVVWHRRGLTPTYVPPISLEFAARRDTYITGLTAFRNGDVNAWFATFTDASNVAANTATRYLDDVKAVQNGWRRCLRSLETPPRADAAAWKLVDELPAHPAINLSIATQVSGRSKAVANNALSQLEKAGILRPVGSQSRNRVWEATDLLALIARLDN